MESNQPIEIETSEAKPGLAGWMQVWIKAVTKPSEQTFIEIANSQQATQKIAFLWVFIAGTSFGFLQALIVRIGAFSGISAYFTLLGIEQYMAPANNGDAGSIILSIGIKLLSAPILGAITVASFAIGIAFLQWIAKLFGGTGTFSKLAYAYAAFYAPLVGVSSIITLFYIIPYIGYCATIISQGIGLYTLYLQIVAMKAVHRLDWGRAVGAVLIPYFAVVLLIVCWLFGLFALLSATNYSL